MNPRIEYLQSYPFERLRQVMAGVVAPEQLSPILLQMGEPKHPPPAVITSALAASLGELGKYPLTAGLPELRQACAAWMQRRYGVSVDADTRH